ncbi:MAG: type IV pilin protein [Candidatus Sedimenticola sp. (ex Thyasira tokunagai)]
MMENILHQGRNRKLSGFTLVELMIVVAVIGILAAIAYPSYNEQVRKSRRTDAQTALMEVTNREEIFFSNFNTYTTVVVSPSGCTGAACGLGYIATSPEGYYNISVAAGTAGIGTSFTASAARVSGSAQASDKCGTFTLTDTGLQGVSSAASGYDADRCW